MKRWLILGVVVACLCSDAQAQHLGSRAQWQPETMPADPRLEQPVEIEIIGRAAVPALELLSQATGVSLTVAPEDLNTVGERKLTIISKGLTLKAIMAQLPEALQEAHWDIDTTGEEPAYLLHRNGDVEASAERERQERHAANQERLRKRRLASVGDVRRALAMSPDELAELEKTDLFLARAARHSEFRTLMESLLSLPEESLAELTETGHTQLGYRGAPPELRQAAELLVQQQSRWLEWVRSWPPDVKRPSEFDEAETGKQLTRLEQAMQSGADVAISIRDLGGREVGRGATMQVETDEGSVGQIIVPAHYPWIRYPGNYYQFLLVETGEDFAKAREMSDYRTAEWITQRDAREWDEGDWVEPSDPRLHQTVALPANRDTAVPLSAVQQALADGTGMSVVSDYFTGSRVWLYPTAPALGGPVWRDLYVLGRVGRYDWQVAGDCLVFHHTSWYELAQGELPESVLNDYLQRVARQGHLTLDDVAELASIIAGRSGGPRSLPRELSDAHASDPWSRWALLLWRALSPDERAAAEGEQGLCFGDLPGKRAAALARTAWPDPGTSQDDRAPEERIRGGVFRMRKSAGSDERGAYTRYDLSIEYPGESREPTVISAFLHEVKPEPNASAAPDRPADPSATLGAGGAPTGPAG